MDKLYLNFTEKECLDFLNFKSDFYNNPEFINTDPIQIPHLFSQKEDIEIAGFLTATISWGNRKMIINNATKLIKIMNNSPFDFVMNYEEKNKNLLQNFVHRTFNEIDLNYFILALQNIYKNKKGLENQFIVRENFNLQQSISMFKTTFFDAPHPTRTEKHISDPNNNSAAKRINMFLRWMARKDNKGVDFGIWKNLDAKFLSCPLDVHSGNVARKLGLLHRKQNDAKALQELDQSLRFFCPNDPVKYDFALFGLGVFEGF
ncbi:MAG: TIGR02757 family protein [Flavobacterium sp.]